MGNPEASVFLWLVGFVVVGGRVVVAFDLHGVRPRRRIRWSPIRQIFANGCSVTQIVTSSGVSIHRRILHSPEMAFAGIPFG